MCVCVCVGGVCVCVWVVCVCVCVGGWCVCVCVCNGGVCGGEIYNKLVNTENYKLKHRTQTTHLSGYLGFN